MSYNKSMRPSYYQQFKQQIGNNQNQEISKILLEQKNYSNILLEHNLKPSLSKSKKKFDIKKFERNFLKDVIGKTKNSHQIKFNNVRQQNLQLLNHQKQKSLQRSKSRKQLQQKKRFHESQIFQKIHSTNNNKLLRQKLLFSLSQYEDVKMINIQDSIPILNNAGVLKLLKSIQETKQKIREKTLTEGRVKQQAKFIYFLWKMINQEEITTKKLKEIILFLNQLGRNQLIQKFKQIYKRNQQIIKMLVQCWTKLKMNKFFYQIDKKCQKNQIVNINKENTLNNYQIKSKRLYNRCKTQVLLSQNKNYEEKTNNIKYNYENCIQNPDKGIKIDIIQQKKLVERLYDERKNYMNQRQRIKTLNDEEKQNVQIKKCTFKPSLIAQTIHRSSSVQDMNLKTRRFQNYYGKEKQFKFEQIQNQRSFTLNIQNQQKRIEKSSSAVKGFQKAVNRLKNGHDQNKIKKQLMNYYSVGQNYQKIKNQGINPPKFLSRQKNKKVDIVLFVIEFQIGRHKVKIKLHPTDTQTSVSRKIAKIYGLKPEEQQQIKEIVGMELNLYYKKIGESVSEFIEE